jgi:hypothetical protein
MLYATNISNGSVCFTWLGITLYLLTSSMAGRGYRSGNESGSLVIQLAR